MDLFVIVIAILFIQVWGADNPLHRDDWLQKWMDYLAPSIRDSSILFIASVGAPVLLTLFVFWLIASSSYWLMLPLSVLVLLYSFGRGEFTEIVSAYTRACYQDDWASGVQRAAGLGVHVDDVAENDWSSLHLHVLEQAAYRGFERMFAILFWFFLFGPAAALCYRLTFLFNTFTNGENKLARRVLWLAEWPAVRVLGLTFALTGNFVGCIQRWRESVLCLQRPTEMTVGQSVLGALSVDDDVAQTCEVTQNELLLLDKLYRRTLWFWLAAAALLIIMV